MGRAEHGREEWACSITQSQRHTLTSRPPCRARATTAAPVSSPAIEPASESVPYMDPRIGEPRVGDETGRSIVLRIATSKISFFD